MGLPDESVSQAMESTMKQLRWIIVFASAVATLGCGGAQVADEAEQRAILQTIVLVNRAHTRFEQDISSSSDSLFTAVKYETPSFVARAKRCLQSPTPKRFAQQYQRYVEALDELLEYVDEHDYNNESDAVLAGYAELADKVGEERAALKKLMAEFVPEMRELN